MDASTRHDLVALSFPHENATSESFVSVAFFDEACELGLGGPHLLQALTENA